MTSAEPVRPAAPREPDMQASVLAALQLVEDARHDPGPERRRRRERVRQAAERAVVSRKLARDLHIG